MSFHILAKDLRRLWPFVLGLAAIMFLSAIQQVVVGVFPNEHPELSIGSLLFSSIIVPHRLLPVINGLSLLCFLLVAMAVQLDALPGERQDWLIRPIRRRDLFLAKLLFVATAIHLPMLGADLVQGMGAGIPFVPTLGAALAHYLQQFFAISLPALAIGAVTRTIGQGFGVVLACFAGALASIFLLMLVKYGGPLNFPAGNDSFSGWLLKLLVVVAGACVILALQYARRATRTSRRVLAASVFLGVAAPMLLPAAAAFAIDDLVSPSPRQTVAVAFAPELGKRPGRLGPAVSNARAPFDLPLRVTGLAPGVTVEGLVIRTAIIAPNRRRLVTEGPVSIRGHVPGRPVRPFHQRLYLTKRFLQEHGDEKVRVELDILLDSFAPRGRYQIKAEGGALYVPGIGYCATRINRRTRVGGPDEERIAVQTLTNVILGCLQAGRARLGLNAALFDPASGNRNPAVSVSYRATDTSYDAGMLARFGTGLVIAADDKPVGPARLPTAMVELTVTERVARVVQHLVIEDVRLKDWVQDGVP